MLRAARTQGITNDMRRNRQVKYSLLWRSWQNYATMPNDSCVKLDFFIHATSACNEIQLLPRNLLEYRDWFSFFCSLCKQLLKTLFVNNLVPWMAILYHIASQYFETLFINPWKWREGVHSPTPWSWTSDMRTIWEIRKTFQSLRERDSYFNLENWKFPTVKRQSNIFKSFCTTQPSELILLPIWRTYKERGTTIKLNHCVLVHSQVKVLVEMCKLWGVCRQKETTVNLNHILTLTEITLLHLLCCSAYLKMMLTEKGFLFHWFLFFIKR